MTVVVLSTTPAATCQVETLDSLYSMVYAVIGILSKVSGGSQAKTTDVAVIAVIYGFDGEPGLARPIKIRDSLLSIAIRTVHKILHNYKIIGTVLLLEICHG